MHDWSAIDNRPGKFQGEPEWVKVLWELALQGGADVDGDDSFIFYISKGDIIDRGVPANMLGMEVILTEDGNGFVHAQWIGRHG